MTWTPTRALMDEAAERAVAVPAFNVITLDQACAVITGASAAGVGVLLQVSETAIRWHGSPEPLLAACRELAVSASIPVGIHVDHVADRRLVDRVLPRAADLGVGSIMFDASTLDYEDNVSATAEVVAQAHAAGLWVEGELGEIGGKDGAHAPGARTDPGEARAFAESTGLDGLAVAVGSSHAMRSQSAAIDIPLVSRIAESIPVPLVLHGSSGVADVTVREAVEAGIRKVNVGTALNVATTTTLRTALDSSPDSVDPRKYSSSSRDAVAALVAHLCHVIASR